MGSRQHGRGVLFGFALESPGTCMRSGSGRALSRGLDGGLTNWAPRHVWGLWIRLKWNPRKLSQTHEIGGQRMQPSLVWVMM